MGAKMDRIMEIIPLVKEAFPVSEAFKGRVKNLRIGYPNSEGLCPFHNNKTLGSFSGSDAKGIWKCFACGPGGDSISFVRDYENLHGKNVTYIDVALYIAKEKGIISDTEYAYLSKRSFSPSDNLKVEKVYNQKELFQNKVADEKTLNKVYSLFIRGNEYLGKPRLTDEHKTHLLNERNLREEDIEKVGYFSFPKRYITRKFLASLEENEIPLSTLQEVPGFFFDKVSDRFEFTIYPSTAIGIPCRNKNGNIVAIQLRKDTVSEKEQRYVWFSSAWAQDKKDKSFGCSPGAPVNVIYPDVLKTKDIYITEGQFKAMQLSKRIGAVALSVQGVSSWRKILPIINEIPHRTIYIAFDADMAYNEGVFLQAIKMGLSLTGIDKVLQMKEDINLLGRKGTNQKELIQKIYKVLYDEYILNGKINPQSKSLKVKYMLWDAEKGKGIDDFLEKYNLEEIKVSNMTVFFSKYAKFIFALEEEYKKIPEENDIPKETRQQIFRQILL